MSEHIRTFNDDHGNVVEISYFCSAGCYRDSFAADRMGEGGEGGAAPCASSEPGCEQDVYCAECGVLMASPDKEPPMVVNLIDRPPIGPFGEALPRV